MNKKRNFIVASVQLWHKERLHAIQSENWFFVNDRKKLDELVFNLNPRYVFFLHWRHIVPQKILDKTECVCFHMTDVPYGRGGSPLQNLIVRGHRDTKLTALKMTGDVDAGPVYCKKSMSLEGAASEIYQRAEALSWDIIEWMVANEPIPTAQEGEVVLFTRRKPEQSEVPSGLSTRQLYDFIRMLDAPGYPHAFVDVHDFRCLFTNASITEENDLTADVKIIPKVENNEKSISSSSAF